MAAFPKTTRLVVSGIGREYQSTMDEMLHAISDATMSRNRCLILFPSDDALTFDEIMDDLRTKEKNMHKEEGDSVDSRAIMHDKKNNDIAKGWDVVVIDGTWSQARKMHAKYLQESTGGCLYRVQLSDEAVQALDRVHDDDCDGSNGNATSATVQKGHQLRRHPIKWREISTLEATRLLLNDMHTDGEFEEQSSKMAYYQEIGNDAARRQLGPPRV